MAASTRDMISVKEGPPTRANLTGDQLIIFLVGEVTYGLGIAVVREVQAWTGASPLPGMPSHIRGIINLRGVIIPIVDLRARFSQGVTEAGDEHVLVIVVLNGSRFGILVDGVCEIITVTNENIRPVPPGQSFNEASLLTGIVKSGDNIHAILDAKRVVGVQ